MESGTGSLTREIHQCGACGNKKVAFTVLHVRPIYFGAIYTLEDAQGHQLIEHRRS